MIGVIGYDIMSVHCVGEMHGSTGRRTSGVGIVCENDIDVRRIIGSLI